MQPRPVPADSKHPQKDWYAGTRAPSWTPLHHESPAALSCDEGSRCSRRVCFLHEYFQSRRLFRHGPESGRGPNSGVAFENAERNWRRRGGRMEVHGSRSTWELVKSAEWEVRSRRTVLVL